MTGRTAAQVGEWMRSGTRLLLDAVDGLADADFDGPTALPGWSRRHLVAHVHFNAEALRRLVHWARTGERTPMYASREERDAEIEAGTRLAPAILRDHVHASARALAADLDGLPESAWRAEVLTAQGRTVPATEIPWMRTREVAIHAVDLDAGVSFADLPDALNAALAADALDRRLGQGHGPALAGWLTGRTHQAPELEPWL